MEQKPYKICLRKRNMEKGLFKCSRKKIKKLVKDLKEDTEMLDLSKIQLIDKIRKLKNQNKKLRKKLRSWKKDYNEGIL